MCVEACCIVVIMCSLWTVGTCDGSLRGRHYFQCPPYHGVFVKPADVICVTGRKVSRERSGGEKECDQFKLFFYSHAQEALWFPGYRKGHSLEVYPKGR